MITGENLQYDSNGNLRHLLAIENLKRETILTLIESTKTFFDHRKNIVANSLLKNKSVANVFFENSTRTTSSFTLAAQNLGADVLNFNVATSSTQKGESLLDNFKTLHQMPIDLFVIRHNLTAIQHFLVHRLPNIAAIINAGDGTHEHPTQALLDVYTIQEHKPDWHNLCVCIVGDIKHSRVARSLIFALHLLGVAEIRIVGPKTLLPAHSNVLGVQVFHQIKPAVQDADVIVTLRLQQERMQHALLPSFAEYHRFYGLNETNLANSKPDVLIMHPGPMNRGVEISSTVADSKNAVILDQVKNGTAVRMAVMAMLVKQAGLS